MYYADYIIKHFHSLSPCNPLEIPENKPTIEGVLSRYRPGDVLRGNCSSEFSKPATNLTWTVNDVPVGDAIHFKIYLICSRFKL